MLSELRYNFNVNAEPLLMVVRLIWRKILSEMASSRWVLYGHSSFKLYSAPSNSYWDGPPTSGDSPHLLQKTSKESKSYQSIVAKCICFQLEVA
jgi:hypothetical protein